MRCSKLCFVLLLIGIGGAVILALNGNTKAASFLSFLPILACPLMCVFMMRSCKDKDGKCHKEKKAESL